MRQICCDSTSRPSRRPNVSHVSQLHLTVSQSAAVERFRCKHHSCLVVLVVKKNQLFDPSCLPDCCCCLCILTLREFWELWVKVSETWVGRKDTKNYPREGKETQIWLDKESSDQQSHWYVINHEPIGLGRNRGLIASDRRLTNSQRETWTRGQGRIHASGKCCFCPYIWITVDMAQGCFF